MPIAAAGIPGTEGMSDEEIAREVFAGGRFVMYPWCVSIVLMTFRRASPVRFLRKDQDGFAAAFGYSLISLFFGWWGFPHGVIYTPLCLFYSATGGKDVTRDVLTNLTGNPQVEQLLREASKRPRRLKMWLLPLAILLMPIVCFFGVLNTIASADRETVSRQGRSSEFQRADRFVANHRDASAGGNTGQAREIAQRFSTKMKTLRDSLYTKSTRKSSISFTDGEFLTWCEIRGDQAVVLVHVPDLRKFDTDAKESLAKLAWIVANAEIAALPQADRPTSLAVATRGALLYDRLLEGTVAQGAGDDQKAPQPSETVEGSRKIETRLNALFSTSASALH